MENLEDQKEPEKAGTAPKGDVPAKARDADS